MFPSKIYFKPVAIYENKHTCYDGDDDNAKDILEFLYFMKLGNSSSSERMWVDWLTKREKEMKC